MVQQDVITAMMIIGILINTVLIIVTMSSVSNLSDDMKAFEKGFMGEDEQIGTSEVVFKNFEKAVVEVAQMQKNDYNPETYTTVRQLKNNIDQEMSLIQKRIVGQDVVSSYWQTTYEQLLLWSTQLNEIMEIHHTLDSINANDLAGYAGNIEQLQTETNLLKNMWHNKVSNDLLPRDHYRLFFGSQQKSGKERAPTAPSAVDKEGKKVRKDIKYWAQAINNNLTEIYQLHDDYSDVLQNNDWVNTVKAHKALTTKQEWANPDTFIGAVEQGISGNSNFNQLLGDTLPTAQDVSNSINASTEFKNKLLQGALSTADELQEAINDSNNYMSTLLGGYSAADLVTAVQTNTQEIETIKQNAGE